MFTCLKSSKEKPTQILCASKKIVILMNSLNRDISISMNEKG